MRAEDITGISEHTGVARHRVPNGKRERACLLGLPAWVLCVLGKLPDRRIKHKATEGHTQFGLYHLLCRISFYSMLFSFFWRASSMYMRGRDTVLTIHRSFRSATVKRQPMFSILGRRIANQGQLNKYSAEI